MRVRFRFLALLFCVFGASLISSPQAHAQTPGEFSLQVTPSPLVTTLKPGQKTELELKIRNASSTSEELKIEPRSFTLAPNTGDVRLNDTTPPDIAQWISFSNPTFTVQPGQWYTQKVRFNLPKDTGFSYSFALVVSRKNAPVNAGGGRLLKGSVAVFTLVNIDRPGATRKLSVAKFVSAKRVYEYLPASFDLQLKNTGNSIVQPYGNIYIQRKTTDAKPVGTLAVNEKKSYLLPGSFRSITAQWVDGFPAYTSSISTTGTETTKLTWDFDKVSHFRIGKYTAKLVAVYNDGQRDVPLEAEVSFWVIPWRTILAALSLGALIWYVLRKRAQRRTAKAVEKALKQHSQAQAKEQTRE